MDVLSRMMVNTTSFNEQLYLNKGVSHRLRRSAYRGVILHHLDQISRPRLRLKMKRVAGDPLHFQLSQHDGYKTLAFYNHRALNVRLRIEYEVLVILRASARDENRMMHF
jgi:hypothetical protein